MKSILLYILVAMITTSCNYELKSTGKMPLRQLLNKEQISKESSGHYFLVMGSYSSSETAIQKISMFVLVDSSYRLLEYDLKSIRVKIDNTIDIPYLEIKAPVCCGRTTQEDIINSGYEESITITCPERYLPEQLIPISITN